MIGFLKKLYAQVYITIIAENHYIWVKVYVEKMGFVKETKEERFDLTDGIITEEVANFIERYERKSPFSYITLLNPLLEQGAKQACDGKGMNANVWLCAGGKKHPWSIYSDAIKLKALQKQFQKLGLDFIFSPFSLIYTYVKSLSHVEAKMYIFILEKSMSVAVFRKGFLEFARQISLEEPRSEFDEANDNLVFDHDDLMEDDLQNDTTGLDFDIDINTEPDELEHDIESLDELQNLDDLDALDDDDEQTSVDSGFIEEEEVVLEPESDLFLENSEKGLGGFSRNYKRFELIQEAIDEFYHLTDIESSFIENVFIMDPYEDASDLKGYLEDELFVKVEITTPQLHDLLLGLTKSEIKNAS